MMAVQSGTPLCALWVLLKKKKNIPAEEGGTTNLSPSSDLGEESPIPEELQRRARRHATINVVDLSELELELIQTQMAQKPMLRAEVGMRVRCANNASAE
jgi:hypothetical protein